MLTSIAGAVPTAASKGANVMAEGYDPEIGVNENVPGAEFASDMAGGVFFYIYIGLGVGLGVAAMLWGLGKILKNQAMQSVGIGAILAILGAAVIVGGVNGLIAWFSSRNLT